MSALKPALADIALTDRMVDVQGRTDFRELPIDWVGVRRIKHPFRVQDRNQNSVNTVVELDMYVNLPATQRGTHMSRFIELLNEHDQDRSLSVDMFSKLTEEMVELLGAEEGMIKASFDYFRNKQAPVSKVNSMLDYRVTLVSRHTPEHSNFDITVVVPVTSLCPCSKEISNYGAHNQRSHITITATSKAEVWIEDLIDIAEEQASCQLYGILKRPDEKYVTEKAYDNPKFVEDLVRDIALKLEEHDRILAYVVESENFESIHNHSAYALIRNDKRAN